MNPDDIKYHREHAWVRAEGKRATIGITDYAQQQMGDIVYIDLPEVDTEIDADSELSEVESTKATSLLWQMPRSYLALCITTWSSKFSPLLTSLSSM